ncbi:hypothetical protein HYN59_17915 [Flavobacterium album]|uniref:Uncharacterized protein n=1 Tax=Flavobacterium album TaxID=2175091 RepID=A0A2S1R2H5_9FLAO|nr:hypothetical protein [Flavobacterium album]AWH86870.1 hypothetical protein HYN59_17915 [Flavobacterium album]
MSSDTFYIKEGPHFKLWVSLRDKIVFEAALVDEAVPFHVDDNQSTLGSDIRYFLPDAYRQQVDIVLKRKSVAASTDTIGMYGPEVNKKVNKMYLTVVAVVILLLVVGTMLFGCEGSSAKYYFNFDEVIHYQIKDNVIREIWDKKDKGEAIGKIDSITLDHVYGWHEGSHFDKSIEAKLSQTKFEIHPLDTVLNSKLRGIFKEDTPLSFTTTCEPTFRDIFLFKKNKKIIGIAKICFECYKTEFAGTSADENRFSHFQELKAIVK